MKNIDLVASQLSHAIAVFMKTKTSYTNGYETRVEGEIRANVLGRLDISYPECRDKTLHTIETEGSDLHSILYNFLGEEFLKKYIVRVYSKHESDGCYFTYVDIILKTRINW
jgi:hypothetical protein